MRWGWKDSLVRLTRPGYNNFSRSLSVTPTIDEGAGVPTRGAAEAKAAFAGDLGGLVVQSIDADLLVVCKTGVWGVGLLVSVILSS